MKYWRMQLHPDDQSLATDYTVKCLTNNYVGLDFPSGSYDLSEYDIDKLEAFPNNIRAFAKQITYNDYILIFHHNIPFALITEIGNYNYLKEVIPEMGIWFRHFRRFKKISYFNDVYKQGKDEHYKITMANTISEASEDTKTVELIKDWIGRLSNNGA
ncbi:hypothetical protein [Leptospira interrogans]|uniref:hypothetical protein n=1 Tax=Leptospira interrogans TaxID=173 RepID=UPI0007740673|nr:hypothetical protein [Leptospira interrogans]